MWLEEDRRWAVALLAEEAEACPGCQGQLAETTDADNEFRYHAEALRCHKCAAQQREMESFHKEGSTIGLLVSASLKR